MLRYLLVMGTQNLNNYYFNKVGTKISYDSYYDIFLASDEKDYNIELCLILTCCVESETIWTMSFIPSRSM